MLLDMLAAVAYKDYEDLRRRQTRGWRMQRRLACTVAELRRRIGDGVNQAADLISATASIPSLNFISLTTFGNWF